MRQYELVEKVLSYNSKANEALLNCAYVYAMKAHGQQKRASGDPYFSHPLEVASILTSLKLDDDTIATALLHDTIEDTQTTKDEIERLFGPNIASLVDGLTKIEKLNLVSKKTQQAENFRCPRQRLGADRAEKGHRNRQQHNKRKREAFVSRCEREIHDKNAEAKKYRSLAPGLKLLEREARPFMGEAGRKDFLRESVHLRDRVS